MYIHYVCIHFDEGTYYVVYYKSIHRETLNLALPETINMTLGLDEKW